MKIRHCILLVLLLMLATTASASAATPTEQLRSTVDQVIETLRDKSLSGAPRRQRLSALIRPRFNFPLMAQWVLGTNWRKATPAEKERFVTLFTDTLEETYVGKIENYTDEKVRYLKEKVEGEKAEVATVIVGKSVEIPIDYKLARKGGEWLVYDVSVEGVSLVRNFRSTYDEIVRKDGLPGLLKQMEEKLIEMRANNAGPGKKS
jgi:phospholipid transport system substrate-binding protein